MAMDKAQADHPAGTCGGTALDLPNNASLAKIPIDVTLREML